MFQFRSARGAKGVWGKAMSLSSLKRPTAGNGQQPTKRPRESTSAVFKSFLVSICKSPCPPPKKHPRVPQGHIRVGTACGGWSSEIFALEHLKVKHAHVFDCDKESAVHRLVQHLHKPHIWYDDVTHDDFRTAPACDVFVAGFPCQPFSAAGLGRGMQDHRGLVVLYVVRYIKERKPTTWILENVAGLFHQHLDMLLAIIEALTDITDDNSLPCYSISWRILNARLHGGLPHNRERLFVVGTKKSVQKCPLTWPSEAA